jgi:hypothetical protein
LCTNTVCSCTTFGVEIKSGSIYNGSAGPEWLVKAVGPQAEGSNPSTPQLRYRFITGFIFFNYTPYGARAIGLLGS